MKILGVDIETYDPLLKDMGCGARRPDTYVVGVALTWANEKYQILESKYFPLRHSYDAGGEWWDEDAIKVACMEIQDAIDEADGFIGANIMYDIEFLQEKEGLDFHIWERDRHKYVDVQVAEPIIDENKRGSYSLEDLAQHYSVGTKDDDELYAWLANKYGGKPTRTAQAGKIHLAPIALVAPYAMSDTELPIHIFKHQKEVIRKQNLGEVWALERDLFPMLYAMKERGVRIDVAQAGKNQQYLDDQFQAIVDGFNEASGVDGEISEIANSTAAIVQIIDNWNSYYDADDPERIIYPYTEKGAPSIRKAWLEGQSKEGNAVMRPFAKAIMDYRRVEKNRGTFIQGILKHVTDAGRIHCQFNQLKSDSSGTVSGRFSSSNPNLQNQPARDEEMMPLVRGLFVPEEGEDWGSADYSQIEYVLLVHHAYTFFAKKNGKGQLILDNDGYAMPQNRFRSEFEAAKRMLIRFIEGKKSGKKVDMHQEVADMCDIIRRDGKAINFGMVYGLGVDSLVLQLGYARKICLEIMDKYHGNMPFAKKLYYEMQKIAKKGLHVVTIGGRHRRYPKVQLKVPWKWDSQAKGEPPHYFIDHLQQDEEDPRIWTRRKGKKTKVYPTKAELLEAYREEDRDAVSRWIEFAFCHTALNALLQGGAADIMKRAMLDIWNAGICGILGAPLLTVHDELNWSIPRTPEAREAFEESVRIMERVYSDRLTIPLTVDYETGAHWAECK